MQILSKLKSKMSFVGEIIKIYILLGKKKKGRKHNLNFVARQRTSKEIKEGDF